MENYVTIDWYYNTTWDQESVKLKINYELI